MDKQHLVIGSAGHIDHGKSSIVKALTNIDPTRLKEEKEKNITIDLGFSYFFLNNESVAIIDLPGHEKFISNMIVGSSNIDMILFVIAADDGIMPQTIEHFEILSLLQIKHAIIVLNKADLVTPELLKQRKQEIKDFFEGSIFEKSPLVETSIFDDKSIENLKNTLISYIEKTNFSHKKYDIFRMAIDRSFSMKGLGTIITGTSQGRELFVGETLQTYPTNHLVKVKNIQNHNVDVESISSGHRTALQLSKIAKEDIKRGDIIATPDSLIPTRYLDVVIKVLKSSKPLKNNQLIRLSHQTKEFICRLKLANSPIQPGTSSFATIILQDDIYAIKGDLGIIRQFSPIKTIAGIEIINTPQTKAKVTSEYYEQYLKNDISQHIINLLNQELSINDHNISLIMPDQEQLTKNLNYLIAQQTIKVFTYNNKPQYILAISLQNIETKIIEELSAYHHKNPLLEGMTLIDLHKNYFDNINYKVFKAMVASLKSIRVNNDTIYLNNFKIAYTLEQKNRRNVMMTTLKNRGFSLFSFKELYEKFNENDDKLIIQAMLKQKQLIIVNSDYLILDRMYQEVLNLLTILLQEHEKIYLADFKDSLNVSRKYCLILLDHFDNEKITKRIDDYRLLFKKG